MTFFSLDLEMKWHFSVRSIRVLNFTKKGKEKRGMPSDILWQRQGLQRLGTDWMNHETWQDFSKFLLNSWNRPDRPPPNNFLQLSLKCSSSTAASFINCNLATRDKLLKRFQMARRSRIEAKSLLHHQVVRSPWEDWLVVAACPLQGRRGRARARQHQQAHQPTSRGRRQPPAHHHQPTLWRLVAFPLQSGWLTEKPLGSPRLMRAWGWKRNRQQFSQGEKEEGFPDEPAFLTAKVGLPLLGVPEPAWCGQRQQLRPPPMQSQSKLLQQERKLHCCET